MTREEAIDRAVRETFNTYRWQPVAPDHSFVAEVRQRFASLTSTEDPRMRLTIKDMV